MIGGAAGAIPPLTGWAAANGSLGLGALLLFAIVFAVDAAALLGAGAPARAPYASAEIPMLPVVRGARATAFQVLPTRSRSWHSRWCRG